MGRDQTVLDGAEAGGETAIAERLEVIEEQGRQTLELLRTLIGLLMPKEERDGPSLEDLLAAMIAQQRDLLAIARGTRSDVKKLGETLPSAVAEAVATASVPTRVSGA
jgi:hypothetical protein